MLKRFFMPAVLAFVFLVLAFPVFAVTTITSADFYCDHIVVSYISDNSMGMDEALITITNDDTATVIYTTPILSGLYDVWDGTYSIYFPAQPIGSNLSIQVRAGAIDSTKGVCVPSPVESGSEAGIDYNHIAFGDGRFCFGRGEADAALFPFNDGLAIYRLHGEDGELAILLTAEDLAEEQETNFHIASSADGFIRLYRLGSGQYQINVGPDEEGKVHVCIFGAIPDTTATTFSYFVNGN